MMASTETLPRSPVGPRWRAWAALLLCWALSACSVMWISPHSKESADRVTELTRDVLAVYQELLLAEPQARAAAAQAGRARHAAIDTKMRVHLLQEQARPKNKDSVDIAENLLAAWERFGQRRLQEGSGALGNEALLIERGIMQRHLGAALAAEEAKKHGGG